MKIRILTCHKKNSWSNLFSFGCFLSRLHSGLSLLRHSRCHFRTIFICFFFFSLKILFILTWPTIFHDYFNNNNNNVCCVCASRRAIWCALRCYANASIALLRFAFDVRKRCVPKPMRYEISLFYVIWISGSICRWQRQPRLVWFVFVIGRYNRNNKQTEKKCIKNND